VPGIGVSLTPSSVFLGGAGTANDLTHNARPGR